MVFYFSLYDSFVAYYEALCGRRAWILYND